MFCVECCDGWQPVVSVGWEEEEDVSGPTETTETSSVLLRPRHRTLPVRFSQDRGERESESDGELER